MKITKSQLRRIIREVIDPRYQEGSPGGWHDDEAGHETLADRKFADSNRTHDEAAELEPARFRSKDEAEDSAVSMVFGDDPNQRLGGDLPYEIRIVYIDGEYALYAMANYTDRYNGEGKEIAAVPRGGSIRYGRKIG